MGVRMKTQAELRDQYARWRSSDYGREDQAAERARIRAQRLARRIAVTSMVTAR
jgi:hypothetical protein